MGTKSRTMAARRAFRPPRKKIAAQQKDECCGVRRINQIARIMKLGHPKLQKWNKETGPEKIAADGEHFTGILQLGSHLKSWGHFPIPEQTAQNGEKNDRRHGKQP